jgi:hypothetical protein
VGLKCNFCNSRDGDSFAGIVKNLKSQKSKGKIPIQNSKMPYDNFNFLLVILPFDF